MKNLAKKVSQGISIFTVLTVLGCNPSGKHKNDISNLIPIALMGGNGSTYSEPNDGGKTVSTYNNTDTQITVSSTGSVTNADCSPKEGQAASLCLVSPENVDRYKSLEIIFAGGMDKKSVKAAFSLVSLDSGPIPSPGGFDLDDTDIPDKGGRFSWLAGRRLIFDPYKELKSNETYELTISTQALNSVGTPISVEFKTTFKTEHDFQITHLINGVTLGGNNDITFNKSQPLLLISAFTNPQGAFNNIAKITLNRLGNSSGQEICNSTCSGLLTSFNLNTSAVPPSEGGNTYYYEIQTKDNKSYKRFFTFNYGNVISATSMIPNAATGVLDEGIMMKLLGQIVEKYAAGDFKIKDGTTNKAFSDFLTGEKSGTPRLPQCYDFRGLDDSNGNPVTITYLRSYGDSGSANGDGYCNNKFTATAELRTPLFDILVDTAQVSMDVYVTSVNLAPKTNGQNSVAATLKANQTGELGVDLQSRAVVVGLAVVANFNDALTIAIPAGKKMYFTTTATLNVDRPTDLRLARAKSNITVDGNGLMDLRVNLPNAPDNEITDNLYIKGWTNAKDGHCWTGGTFNSGNFDYNRSGCTDNLYVANMEMKGSNSWIADILNAILPSLVSKIANEMVPLVKANITHAMVKDILQKIAPNVLNSVVGSLKDPGITLNLPTYLPAPLANFPLNVKMKLQSDTQVRVSGANKGLVASVDLGITHGGSAPVGGYRTQANEQGMVYFKPSGALNNAYPFSQISSNPGMLLSLHPDSVTQAAFNMWRARGIDLSMDEAFIDTINQYAGASDLFKLTKTLLQASPIISIMAPGRTTLFGINTSFARLPPIGDKDPITFAMEPIQAPVVKLVPLTGTGVPKVRANLTDLQLAIVGKRTSSTEFPCVNGPISARDTGTSCFYTISTVRVSIDAQASFGFKVFSNPTSNPVYNNLNAIFVEINPNSNFYYTIDVREGNIVNPYGLDPEAIKSVMDPLVKSLVVPLVNNILKEIPLPAKLDFPALVDKSAGTSGGTACKLNVQTTAMNLSTVSAPSTEEYILNKVQPLGAFATNPGSLLECP